MTFAPRPRALQALAPAIALGLAAACARPATTVTPAPEPAAAAAAAPSGFTVPVEYHTLDNGLKVVLSKDTTAPTATIAVYYNIGFRIEPRDRTGFAHLFEHMMFQGSQNMGKGAYIQLIQSNGGVLNGSTRFDYTNYFAIVPAHTLETVIWAESDRMRGLNITQENLTNQQGVVKNEVKVNVLNQPYGGFPWLDMPQLANTNWYNAHNFYGDLADLDSATLDDVQNFFKTYYAPNNAVVVIVGDIDNAQALAWVRRYFGDIPRSVVPPQPDIAEPPQTEERRLKKTDVLAQRPALAVAYHVPERNTPEWYAMGMIDQILGQGRDSRLHQTLVQERGLTGGVSAGINIGLGNMFNYKGPMLWTVATFHDQTTTPDTLLSAIESQIASLRDTPIDQATLDRALVKMRSNLYGNIESMFGFGRADLLASFALFDDDPARLNRLEAEFRKVTPELIQRTAREYLGTNKRSVLIIEPRPQS